MLLLVEPVEGARDDRQVTPPVGLLCTITLVVVEEGMSTRRAESRPVLLLGWAEPMLWWVEPVMLVV